MNPEIHQALLDWNPWLQGAFPIKLLGMQRAYDLSTYLKVPEIKIIEGARRVGKSTLLYQVIHGILEKQDDPKSLLYVNFEDEILSKYSLSDIVYTYLQYSPIEYLFVDEIQNCIDWVQFIRKIYDRQEIKQIWVSGSNASLIKQEYATLLTGRNLSIQIFTLSFREFLKFKSYPITSKQALDIVSKKQNSQLHQLFSEYIEYGAFPAVVNREVLKKELLTAYFEDFIYKDIVSRYNINSVKLKELAIYLATNTTKLFSYRNIAAALNSHINTVTEYINYLNKAFLFEELYKFDFSLQKQYANNKKIYCLDTGLAAAVSFKFSKDTGRIIENIVYSELRRRKHDIYFNRQKYECDFLIKKELSIVEAIQVCLSLDDPQTKQRELNGLLEAMRTYDLKHGIILTYAEEGEEIVKEDANEYIIEIKSIYKWLLS